MTPVISIIEELKKLKTVTEQLLVEPAKVLKSLIYLSEEAHLEAFKEVLERFKVNRHVNTSVKRKDTNNEPSIPLFEEYKQLAIHIENGFDHEVFLEFQEKTLNTRDDTLIVSFGLNRIMTKIVGMDFKTLSKEELENLEKVLNEFYSIVSHQKKDTIGFLMFALPVNFKHLELLKSFILIKDKRNEFEELYWLELYAKYIKSICYLVEELNKKIRSIQWNIKANKEFIK